MTIRVVFNLRFKLHLLHVRNEFRPRLVSELSKVLMNSISLDEANLSPAARAFYSENRRVANGKAERVLGWRPRYTTFREGLAGCFSPSAPPASR